MNIEEKLSNLPDKPGVYLFKGKEDKVLYIGKALMLRNRVRSYFQKSRPLDPRLQILVSRVKDLEWIVTDSDVEALILESTLIKKHKPRYNINLKDDKSYPYIRITAEDFPQVFPTRRLIRDGSSYFGPYTNVKDMREALTTLKRLFTIRTCKYDLDEQVVARKKVQLCLQYYIKRCLGPCQGLQEKEDYARMIEKVKQFLKGKTNQILSELQQEMSNLAGQQQYEDAARIRDKIEVLEKYRNAQKVELSDPWDRDVFAVTREDDDACAVIFRIREGKIISRVHYYLNGVLDKEYSEVLEHFINQYYSNTQEIPEEIFIPQGLPESRVIAAWLSSRSSQVVKIFVPKAGEKKKLVDMCEKNARYLLEELKLQKMKARNSLPFVLQALQRDLNLPRSPRRIECFDISNIQGSDPVASMVCFIDGRPHKSDYRKFRINSKETPDDFAMMREVIKRRYSRVLKEQKGLPDLIMVDGGQGQLSSALTVLHELNLPEQPVIGLAKKLEEIYIPGFGAAQMLPKTSASLKLLQKIRDEAHRFAVTYHRQRRSKRTLTSELDRIPGIGPKRRNQLLKIFGSVEALKATPVEVIGAKGKIPQLLAERIYNFLHPLTKSWPVR
jgi:excinuclease ABC subunit C